LTRPLKRLAITLFGSLTQGATRSYILEVTEDVNPATLDSHVLEDLADQSQIAWIFENDGLTLMTDHHVENDPHVVSQLDLYVISLACPQEEGTPRN
jgi:hypothetical protein